ncbi:LOW QUALITY PROTEIN: survival motor neuron protein 1-like [Phoenicopterus ruber ruber]
MAESAPRPRGADPRAGGPSPGKAAIPGAAPLRSPRTSLPRDAPGEVSDGGSETPTSSVTPSEEEEEEEGHQWRVGDACSTAWAGDGLLYPARLRALDPAAGTCLVEFEGYGNTEERALADLLPPRPGAWGASDTPGGEGPRAEPRRPSTSSWDLPPGARRRKGEQGACSPRPPEVMPPASLRAMWEEEEEEDALATMLMAWYMSGYHTGFYVGLREGRAEAAEPPPRPRCRRKKPPRS